MENSIQVRYDENAMDIDNTDSNSVGEPSTSQPFHENNDRYDVVIVSSLGLHVEGPIPFINPQIPIVQHEIVQVELNEPESTDSGEVDRISPTISFTSSRNESPIIFVDEESNQSANTVDTTSAACTQDNKESSRKRSLSDDDENEDDGKLCPICLDNWTSTGDHRICSLKCGHLFGYKCVTRWLESQTKKSCPTCKKKVGRGDLRFLYARKLIAIDNAELELMRQQLDTVTEQKNRIMSDMSKVMLRERMLNQEVVQLRKLLEKVGDLSNVSPSRNNFSNQQPIVRLFMDKSLEICRQSGCRVFDVNCSLDLIMTSMKSPNSLFAGYGIRKVNISQYKPLAFVPLHNQQIRDIAFHPKNSWVLTASMDKSFKVVNCVTNAMITTTSQTMPLWSCCWDADNEYLLYIGTQSGNVVKYDVRRLADPICSLAVPGDISPVVSVASLPSRPGEQLAHGGVISCKLNSLWVFENTQSDYKRHILSLEGPFVSMKYQLDTKQLLVSSRPNNRISYSRHILCTLERTAEGELGCNVIHSFQGGGMQKLLSKSCFLASDEQFVAAHQESSKSVYLWSINSGQKVCSVPAHDAVLDLRGVQNQNGNYLVSLTEKKLEFFKFH